jgi:hypothetical protein
MTDVEVEIEDVIPSGQHPEEKSVGSNRHRVQHAVVAFYVIAGITVGVSMALTGSANPVDFFIPPDPPGASEAIRWAGATQGLRLIVENACEDFWTPYFDRSLLEWNESEALILTSRRVAHDFDCSPVTGRLKVCNGNYGNTDWLGINIALVDRSQDVKRVSTSKLNDFHLKNDDDMRYIM